MEHKIRITRGSHYADRARAYKVVLDGRVLGKIKNGERQEYGVAPGRHRLVLRIDWCRSNVIEFETGADAVEFECGNSMRGVRVVLALLYVTLLCDRYLWLRRV